MRFYPLLIVLILLTTRAQAQQTDTYSSRLYQFIQDTEVLRNEEWATTTPRNVVDISRGQYFGSMLTMYRVFGRSLNKLPPGKIRTDGVTEYNDIFAINGYQTLFFDPLTGKTAGILENSREFCILFSTKQAYQAEIAELEKTWSWNKDDGSLREKTGRFIAYPLEWANNAPKPRIYRGLRVYAPVYLRKITD